MKDLARKLVPQWVAVAFCTGLRHPQRRYSAWADGIQVIVHTCICGRKQDSKIVPASRRIRRRLGHRGKA